MPDAPKIVNSIEDLQRDARAIIEAITADAGLARAALANPILALQEIGYEIDPAVRPALERRLRFDNSTAARLEQLQQHVHEIAGREFDLDDPDELHAVLFDELHLEPPDGHHQGSVTHRLRPQLGWERSTRDPLERLDRAHPIVGPLLEYRRLEASEPRLAAHALFERIRNGRTATPITGVTVRLRRS